MRELIVVGAGAAGTWLAWRAAQAGLNDVLLLEKTPRVGTKILASGGSRCNLTTTLGSRAARELFGNRAARFLGPAFNQLPPKELRRIFEDIGVPSEEAPLEKVFPKSGSAKNVRDALENAARHAGVKIEFESPVRSVQVGEDRIWRVELEHAGASQLLETKRLAIATGGQSFASSGTTGDGYDWLQSLSLRVVEPAPALAPLTSPCGWVRELSGVALQNCELRLMNATGKLRGRRRRPLLFTHVGVSGPGPMDLSRAVGREGGKFELRVDLVPDCSRDELREALISIAGRKQAPLLQTALSELLSELAREPIPKRILERLLLKVGIDPRAGHQALGRGPRHELIELIKGLPIEVDGTCGFDKAEVTSGGLHLDSVDPKTCRVRGLDGLWVIGELLDLDGPIGGLNFQSAFATAELAALDITASER